MQRSILQILDEKHGMTSTKTLKTAMHNDICDQSFYRSLNSLEKRGLIWWHREHGGPQSSSGLVCLKHGSVLLIDADSTIPNIALMKLSAYHKTRGDTVDLHRGLKMPSKIDYDIVYISCIYTHHARAARRLAKLLSTSCEVHLGGSGVDLKTTLPDEIEHLMPDYVLYPECNYSIGYTMRGCIRSCDFCQVRGKEGYAHPVADIYEFWDRRHKKLVLLDNNILALPDWFKKIAGQIKKENLRVDWNQGLDLRLVNEENAKILAGLHFSPYMRFAWDDIKSEPMIRRGIEILKAAGIKQAMFYVLCDFNSTFEEDLYRINTLKDLGMKAFVMLYNKELLKDKRYNSLMNFSNARMHFYTQTFEEYCTGREDGTYKLKAQERKQRLEIKKNPPPVLHGIDISSIEF